MTDKPPGPEDDQKVADKGPWQIIYAPQQGAYYFENPVRGKTQWEPPAEFADIFPFLDEVKALQGIDPAHHQAACKIQKSLLKQCKKGEPKPLFEKHLDAGSGRFYYRHTVPCLTLPQPFLFPASPFVRFRDSILFSLFACAHTHTQAL